jgi:DNA invertase Pin-like site-specific DNA recombinase
MRTCGPASHSDVIRRIRLAKYLENLSQNHVVSKPRPRRDNETGAAVAIIGYARVSTTDQNPQLQLDALKEASAARVFTDHGVSGSTAQRPQLEACLDHLREGDVLTVWKLDRLGRNTQHVLAVVDELTSRGIGFRSITEGLHTEGAMGKAMLTIMAAFAQLERDTMIERTRAGLAAAAADGRKGGRPRKVDDAAATKARSLREKGVNATDIAKMLGVSRATVYRYLADDEPLSA